MPSQANDIKGWTALEGTDLAILNLTGHPECPAATNFHLGFDQVPRIQLFPAAAGMNVDIVGWPGGSHQNAETANFCQTSPYMPPGKPRDNRAESRNPYVISTLGGIRTPDTRLRTAVFYPAELRGHNRG